jgi:hypothetical protein
VVSFTPRPLYPQGKSPRYPLYRRLGGPQSQSGRRGEKSFPYRDSNFDLSAVQPVASRYTDCAIPNLNYLNFTIYCVGLVPRIRRSQCYKNECARERVRGSEDLSQHVIVYGLDDRRSILGALSEKEQEVRSRKMCLHSFLTVVAILINAFFISLH